MPAGRCCRGRGWRTSQPALVKEEGTCGRSSLSLVTGCGNLERQKGGAERQGNVFARGSLFVMPLIVLSCSPTAQKCSIHPEK